MKNGGKGRELDSLDAIPDAVVVVDRAGSIVYANQHAGRLFRLENGDFAGLGIEVLIPQRFRQRHTELVDQFFSEAVARHMGAGREVPAIRADGEEFMAEIAIGPIQGGNLVLAIVRDITQDVTVRNDLANALKENERLRTRLEKENRYLEDEIKRNQGFDEIIGNSLAMRSTLEMIDRVAATDATVLILGETGAGKELLARAVHARSQRNARPLIKVDCASLPAGLVESELFGHLKGSFTGAHESRPGRFELADGGTIFLDEIGELSVDLQAKLLRVIEEGEFQRLGARRVQHVDVRIVAATNQVLLRATEEGRFRSDLYHRLNTFPIEVPPLRDRQEDIPLLASFFVSRRCKAIGKEATPIPESAVDALMAYDWPGNVRELRNVCDRAVILSPHNEFVLPKDMLPAETAPSPTGESTADDLKSVERNHILKVLQDCDWKIKGDGNAASRLGLAPSTLRSRMQTLGITRPSRSLNEKGDGISPVDPSKG